MPRNFYPRNFKLIYTFFSLASSDFCFTTNSFSEFGFYSYGDPSVSIKSFGKYNGKTLDCRSILTVYADALYSPDSSIVWFVNGEAVAASQTETVKMSNGFLSG